MVWIVDAQATTLARLNGGPGCSSMIGLFQGKQISPKLRISPIQPSLTPFLSENGPCSVNPDGITTTINPYRWLDSLCLSCYILTVWAVGIILVIVRKRQLLFTQWQMLTSFKWFILTNRSEQGFPLATTRTLSTALTQLRLSSGKHSRCCSKVVNFPSFNHESMFYLIAVLLLMCWFIIRFIFATESYGGHYGPSFVKFFDEQNAKIDDGLISGEKITVSALMINKWVSWEMGFFVQLDWGNAVVGMILSFNINLL